MFDLSCSPSVTMHMLSHIPSRLYLMYIVRISTRSGSTALWCRTEFLALNAIRDGFVDGGSRRRRTEGWHRVKSALLFLHDSAFCSRPFAGDGEMPWRRRWTSSESRSTRTCIVSVRCQPRRYITVKKDGSAANPRLNHLSAGRMLFMTRNGAKGLT